MGLIDFGQYELKMLQEVQTHGEVSKNSIVFFCFVPCLEARNQRITKHKPLMVFQGQKQQLGLHSWKLLIIASLGYKTSFDHRKFLAKRENKTKQNKTMLEVQTQMKELPWWSSSGETVWHWKNRSTIIKHKHKDSSFLLLHSNNTHFSIMCPKQNEWKRTKKKKVLWENKLKI